MVGRSGIHTRFLGSFPERTFSQVVGVVIHIDGMRLELIVVLTLFFQYDRLPLSLNILSTQIQSCLVAPGLG